MVAMLGILVFTGAIAVSAGVIYLSVAPQWRRIARLVSGQIEQPFTPLRELATAERRIAVRRWASLPRRPLPEVRAAA